MKFARSRRVAYLAGRQLRANFGRTVLLVTITSVGLTVFVLLNSMASTSSSDLAEAINSAFGVEGTYRVEVSTELAVDPTVVARHLDSSLSSLGAVASVTTLRYPPEELACSTRAAPTDTEAIYVVMAEQGSSALRVGSESATATGADRCVQGMRLPRGAPQVESILQAAAGADVPPLVVGRASAGDLASALGRPEAVVAIVKLDADSDRSTQLHAALTDDLDQQIAQSGIAPVFRDGVVEVSRIDQGAELRSAERGTQIVYRSVAVAVLFLVGTALLVAQLMNVQERVWFFGLARVWGASRRDLISIVVSEVALLVTVSWLVVMLTLSLVGPLIKSWSEQQFNSPVELLTVSRSVGLALGTIAIATLGATVPALRAVRAEPLEVLE